VDATTLTIIATACRDRVRLRFTYGRPDGSSGERRVEPLRLACTARRWYLLAWDLDREDWRTFRVDRITASPAGGHRFTPREPPDGDVTAYLHRAIFNAPYPHQARVTFHASAEEVAQRVPPTFGWLEAVDEHRCVAHVGGARIDVIPVYLANVGIDFEVHEPPELIEQVRTLAGLFTRAGDRSAG
jgi:predicted DNA-binding transcriptional regulator YafY